MRFKLKGNDVVFAPTINLMRTSGRTAAR